MTDQLLHQTLQAIFTLSRDTLPVDAASIARVVGTSPLRIAEALVELERRGWVDAERARLTMLGLAKAVASGVPKSRLTMGQASSASASLRRTLRGGRGRGGRRVPAVVPHEIPVAAAPRLHH